MLRLAYIILGALLLWWHADLSLWDGIPFYIPIVWLLMGIVPALVRPGRLVQTFVYALSLIGFVTGQFPTAVIGMDAYMPSGVELVTTYLVLFLMGASFAILPAAAITGLVALTPIDRDENEERSDHAARNQR